MPRRPHSSGPKQLEEKRDVDHGEGMSWNGRRHPVALAMLAHSFLTLKTLRRRRISGMSAGGRRGWFPARERGGLAEAAVERATKVKEVVARAMAMKNRWWRAGQILALSRRQLRRLRPRYEERGFDGRMDRRRAPAPRSASLAHPGPLRLGRYSSQGIRVEAHTPDPAPKPAVDKTRVGKATKTAFPTRLEIVQHPRGSPFPPHRRRLGNLQTREIFTHYEQLFFFCTRPKHVEGRKLREA